MDERDTVAGSDPADAGARADLAAFVERERAALRATLGAIAEAVRAGQELEQLCDLLPLAERGHQVAEVFDRILHVHAVVAHFRGPR